MAELDEDALREALARELPEARAVYLYGSQAAGEARPTSDVDLAVLAAEPVALPRLARARETLAEVLGREVDLVDLSRLSTVMRARILSTARLIRDRDPAARERFEAFAYSAYARLNEERREILKEIRREGRVHGR